MSSDRSTGLLHGGESTSYAGMDDHGRSEGVVNKLRYRSPHLVLPLLIALVVAIVLLLGVLAYAAMRGDKEPASPQPELFDYIHYEDANTHLNGFQQAAGNATRQTGTAGYNRSVDYVTSVLAGLTALRYRRQPWCEAPPSTRCGVNVIADTLTGDAGNTVIMGGHLDSYGGPGLNDDASGSTGVLLLAVAVNNAINNGSLTLVNRIRFHWYDAEEAGLRGSRAAVAMGVNATEVGERQQDWVCQLQADMIAAPNYILGVVDSYLMPAGVPNSTLAGSHTLALMFRNQFVALGYPFRNISYYHQQSDQWSYWSQGIPAAFGITGVFELHTADDVRDFGGMLGIAADPVIHTPGDNIFSVNLVAQVKMTRTYAGVLQQLARDANIRTTLNVTHGQPSANAAVPRVEDSWEEMVAAKRAQGRSGPEDDFHAWFPLAREWGVNV